MDKFDYDQAYKEIYPKVRLREFLDRYHFHYKSYSNSKGRQFICTCPFHDDMTPSFSIAEDSGLYNCFVCGGGDFFKFVRKIEHLPNAEATIRHLRQLLGMGEGCIAEDSFSMIDKSFDNIVLPKDTPIAVEEDIDLVEMVLPISEPAEKYYEIVSKRVIMDDIIKYGMRYCVQDGTYWGGRLIIPVYQDGKLVTFAGRDMTGKSDEWRRIKEVLRARKNELSKKELQELVDKYEYKKILYPVGSSLNHIFFNWNEAIKNREEVIICEGIFDALRILKFGYNTLSILSSHLSLWKATRLIKNFDRIIVALDNDNKIDRNGKRSNPGQEAAAKIMTEVFSGANVYNMILPVGKDPDDCSKEEFDDAYQNCISVDNFFTLAL